MICLIQGRWKRGGLYEPALAVAGVAACAWRKKRLGIQCWRSAPVERDGFDNITSEGITCENLDRRVSLSGISLALIPSRNIKS